MKSFCALLVVLFVALLVPSDLHAYLGPGAALSAFGALLALVASVVVGVFGFIWYPIKRIMRAMKRKSAPTESVPVDSTSS